MVLQNNAFTGDLKDSMFRLRFKLILYPPLILSC